MVILLAGEKLQTSETLKGGLEQRSVLPLSKPVLSFLSVQVGVTIAG